MPGLLAQVGLESWWAEAFTEQERALIRDRYKIVGVIVGVDAGQSPLEECNYTLKVLSDVSLASGIANLFQKRGERHIAYKALEKAECLVSSETPILDVHFFLHSKIETIYRDDTLVDGRLHCMEACQQQIAIAPLAAAAFREEYKGPLVEHSGYKRLTMLLEHQAAFLECARVCYEALEAGWAGDWAVRAARCEMRHNKTLAKGVTKSKL